MLHRRPKANRKANRKVATLRLHLKANPKVVTHLRHRKVVTHPRRRKGGTLRRRKVVTLHLKVDTLRRPHNPAG